MKYLLLLLSLLVSSCTCTAGTNTRSPTIAVTKLSCYGGICCWPYQHHKDVHGDHFMVCADQSPDIMGIEPHNTSYDTNGYDSLRVSVKTYFLNP